VETCAVCSYLTFSQQSSVHGQYVDCRCPPPVFSTSTCRCWRLFEPDTFWTDLVASALCDLWVYSDLDCDSVVSLYGSIVSEILDRQVPVRFVSCRRRPLSRWFDNDCRRANRKVWVVERAARRDGPLSAATSTTTAAWPAEHHAYFDLLWQKQRTYWTECVDANKSHLCRLWRYFDELLGRGQLTPPDIDATDIHHYLDNKVTGVRAATAGADPPSFMHCSAGCTLYAFSLTTPADVAALVHLLANKQCLSDPLPTWLLKANADILSPFLSHLFNSCLEHGSVPSSF